VFYFIRAVKEKRGKKKALADDNSTYSSDDDQDDDTIQDFNIQKLHKAIDALK